MPVEHMRVAFKPQSFFKMNPALDVPGANDTKSGLAFTASVDGMSSGACCQGPN